MNAYEATLILFDRFSTQSAGFFSPSNRSRIVAFILKRKMFSEESGDEFSFGVDRLLSEGVYAAAYPLHDVRHVWSSQNNTGLH